VIDVDELKGRHNLRDVIGRDLGKPHYRGATYDTYRCPLHHEKKGYSLVVYDDHWTCHGACNQSGDILTWMDKYHGMAFKDAVAALGGVETPKDAPHTWKTNRLAEAPAEPRTGWKAEVSAPDGTWQDYAQRVVERAQKYLWSSASRGMAALDYLRRRGLTDATIRAAGLGYVPPAEESDLIYGRVVYPEWLKESGKPVRVAVGVTIPHYADGELWGVRIRTQGEIKYMSIVGGRAALYWADHIVERMPIMILEGEFDALVLWQVVGDIINPVAIASASNARLDKRWLPKLVTAPQIVARMDADSAGAKALAKLQTLSPRIKPVDVPQGKDVNEYYLGCLKHPNPPARIRFKAWLARVLERDDLLVGLMEGANDGQHQDG